MSQVSLPYTLSDGQKAYAARLMTNLNALLSGVNASDTILATLQGQQGAAAIGSSVIPSVAGANVQAVLESLAALVLARYTAAETDALLALKEDASKADLLVKSIAFDSSTGKFTFTHQSGATTVIDTALEKVPASIHIVNSGSTYKLRVVNLDNSYTECDVSNLFNETSFMDGVTVDFTTTANADGSKSVTAEVRPGSLNDSHLSSTYQATLAGYVSSAAASAAAATASESNATTAASSASTHATNAANSKNSALASKTSAATSETNAAASAFDSEAYAVGKRSGMDVASNDPAYHNNARYYRDQASLISGNCVFTFHGRSGVVEPAASDYNAGQIDYNNISSGLAASNAQTAIDELAAGKLSQGGGTMTGTLTAASPAAGTVGAVRNIFILAAKPTNEGANGDLALVMGS